MRAEQVRSEPAARPPPAQDDEARVREHLPAAARAARAGSAGFGPDDMSLMPNHTVPSE